METDDKESTLSVNHPGVKFLIIIIIRHKML